MSGSVRTILLRLALVLPLMGSTLLICVSMAAVIAAEPPPPILGSAELYYLEEALRSIKMTPADLLYTKNTHPDNPYRLTQQDFLMANPIQVPFYTDEVSRKLKDAVSALQQYDVLVKELNVSLPIGSKISPAVLKNIDNLIKVSPRPKGAPKLPKEMETARRTLLTTMRRADSLIGEAFASLSEPGRTNLADHGDTFEEWEGYDSLNLPKLMLAGRTMLEAVLAAQEKLRGRMLSGIPAAQFGLSPEQATGGIVFYTTTTLGNIIIGDNGPNQYDGDFALIIDLGGDDVYTGRAGGVDGRNGPRVAVCLDLGGNNRFAARLKPQSSTKDSTDLLMPDNDRLDYCFGGALAGIGILVVDGEGVNDYAAGNWSLGAAHLGVGILLRTGIGIDHYQGLDCSQGAASFGIGMLIDHGANDTYRATYASQGFGSAAGVGALIDKTGDDSYYAGGRYEDFPQRPKGSFIAMSQGFGYGIRPVCSGGEGILLDFRGDDRYHLDNQFGMGGSYWYGFGMLVDDGGNDTYQTGADGDYDGYTMGAGIHLGIGCLIDRAGNDRYHANKIGPAVGWDLSPSWFIDGAGADSFVVTAVDWNYACSGVQNGCGFFVKTSGAAVYRGSGYFPSGQAERDCGSIGIMVNIGEGHYADSGRRMQPDSWFTGDTWGGTNTTWCAGLDIPKPSAFRSISLIDHWPSRAPEVKRFPADTLPGDVDSLPYHPSSPDSALGAGYLQTLWNACVQEEGSNWAKSDTARTRFQSLGLPALHFVIPKMASDDGYERRCAMTMATAIGKNHMAVLLAHLRLKDAVTKRRLITAIGSTGDTTAVAALLPYLSRPGFRTVTVEALGNLKDKRAVEAILDIAASDQFHGSEDLRKTTAVALGRIGDSSAVPLLVELLHDSLFWGRYPAQQALMTIGTPAVENLMAVAQSGQFPANAHAVEALGRIPDPQKRAYGPLVQLLTSEDWTIRGYAAEALGRINDPRAIPILRDLLQTDMHPFARSREAVALDALFPAGPNKP
jgi:HEAT repeat protein